MAEYDPRAKFERGRTSFVRVGEKLFVVTDAEHRRQEHPVIVPIDLIEEHRLRDEIIALVQKDPASVDAGSLRFLQTQHFPFGLRSKDHILVEGMTHDVSIPKDEEVHHAARLRTVKLLDSLDQSHRPKSRRRVTAVPLRSVQPVPAR